MKMSKRGWWIVGLGGFFLVGVVGAALNATDPAQPSVAAPRIIRTTTIPTAQFPAYTMTVEPGVNAESLTAKARDLCGPAELCDVRAWTDEDLVGRGWPLTEREIAAVKYSYSVNRLTGAETEFWDCSTFPTAPPDRCALAGTDG